MQGFELVSGVGFSNSRQFGGGFGYLGHLGVSILRARFSSFFRFKC